MSFEQTVCQIWQACQCPLQTCLKRDAAEADPHLILWGFYDIGESSKDPLFGEHLRLPHTPHVHLNSVQQVVSEEYSRGVSPDTVC